MAGSVTVEGLGLSVGEGDVPPSLMGQGQNGPEGAALSEVLAPIQSLRSPRLAVVSIGWPVESR